MAALTDGVGIGLSIAAAERSPEERDNLQRWVRRRSAGAPHPRRSPAESDYVLGQHGVGYLDEAGNVGALDVVDVAVRALAVALARRMDGLHDGVQAGIHLAVAPLHAHGVLAHFQAAYRYAAGVGSLARCEQDAGFLEHVDGLQGGGHVGTFCDAEAAVGDQRAGVITVQFVLGSAGQGDVAGQVPGTLTGQEFQLQLVGHVQQACAPLVLQVHQVVPVLSGHALGEVQGAAGVGHGNDPGTQFHGLQCRVLGNIAGTGDGHALAFEAAVALLEHFLGEIHAAVTGCFGTDQAATVGQALAGQYRSEFVAQALVLAIQEADLPGTDADVTGGDVQILADVARQLGHEGLAEAHYFSVALALGVEVRAALAAAHGQGGQRVLEYLLEGQELEHAQVDRGVETQAALVRADSAVHLHAVAAVDVNLTVIIHPRHAEHDDPLGLDQALDDARLEVLGVFFQERPQSRQYLFGCLVEFGLVWIAQLQVRQAGVQGVSHGSLFFASLRRNGANLSEASAL